MSNIVLWTVAVLFGLGVILAIVLYIVANKFKVEQDPRIDEVEAVMPGANCGGCGYAGCRAFAENCVKAGNLSDFFCPVGGNDTMKQVASVLGIETVAKAPMVAVVRCDGSCEHRPRVNEWNGFKSCKVQTMTYKGETACPWGCLGCGDCVLSCDFDALHMDSATGLPVVDQDKCTSCGKCVKACPKDIIQLRPKGPRGMRVFVSCVNKDKGAVARKACTAACIGCGKCTKACPHDAIVMENNLAYIDYAKCKLCKKCVAECPTGAIHAVNCPVLKKQEEE